MRFNQLTHVVRTLIEDSSDFKLTFLKVAEDMGFPMGTFNRNEFLSRTNEEYLQLAHNSLRWISYPVLENGKGGFWGIDVSNDDFLALLTRNYVGKELLSRLERIEERYMETTLLPGDTVAVSSEDDAREVLRELFEHGFHICVSEDAPGKNGKCGSVHLDNEYDICTMSVDRATLTREDFFKAMKGDLKRSPAEVFYSMSYMLERQGRDMGGGNPMAALLAGLRS